nr:methyltransferase [Nocardioides perillae]
MPRRLREALQEADFTVEAVAALLGPTAHAALGRNETTPGLRRTGGGSPLETLTRLFLLQAPVAAAEAEAALPGLVDRLAAEGILERSVGQVAARLDVRPYSAADGAGAGGADRALWVVSDLTPGLDGAPTRVGADHVLGISSASTSLAQLTLRHPVERALDLGTGCGVQALHLATHARRVVATDVNRRALRVARLNAALNEADAVEVREGSYFEPVAGEEFDLIATNPPFVISPATGERLVYRDSGLPGDRVVEDIVRAAPRHLAPGGWCQVLANWVIADGTPWDERLAGWLDEECDALVVQREVLDPAAYVELWLKDAGHHGGPDYAQRYDTWLSWLEDQGVEAIGFGWVDLRRRTGSEPGGRVVDLLEWPFEVEQPIAPAIAAWATSAGLAAALGDDDVLAATRLVARADVRQETLGAVGAEDPETVVLRQQLGFRRARTADTVEAALVGACDGDLTVGQVLDALAQLLERDPGATRATYLPVVRELVAQGYLGV